MRIRNNFFWIFLTISIVLFVSVGLALGRFVPFLIHNNIYQCQTWFHTISVGVSSELFRSIILLVSCLLTFWVSARLFFVFYRVAQLKKKLEKISSVPTVMQDLLQRYGLEKKVFFVGSDKLFSFCFGFVYPRIYLSTKLLYVMTTEEIEAILLHEKHHLDHKDSFVMFVAFLVELFFPFFPIISDILAHYRVEREILADRSTVVALGDRSQIVSVLRKMLLNSSYSFVGTASLADTMLEARIQCLLRNISYRKKVSITNSLTSFFSFMVLFFIFTTPVHAVSVDVLSSHTVHFCSTTVRASLPFSWAIDM